MVSQLQHCGHVRFGSVLPDLLSSKRNKKSDFLKLIYNIVLVLGAQQGDLVLYIYIYMFFFENSFPWVGKHTCDSYVPHIRTPLLILNCGVGEDA